MALAPSARPWSQESASSPDKRIASRPPQQQPQLWPSAVLADVQGWHELSSTASTHVWGVPHDAAGTHRLGDEQALLRDMHGLTLGHSQLEAGAALNGNETGLERGHGGQRHPTNGPAHRGHDVRRQRQAVVRAGLIWTSNIHAEAQHLKRRALQVLDSVMALRALTVNPFRWPRQIRRTVYIRNIGSDVTEDNLLAVFAACGSIQDSRMCGDPNSSLRFAFIEFEAENSVAKVFICAYYSHVWRDTSQSERLQMADSC